MKLITRRILFFICLILFLISSPLIILYAFGFRYDPAQKKIVQTGIIYLTPNIQDNIKILINGKEEPNKISIKGIFKKDFALYNLLPKTYNIKVEKENYHTWEKNLVVLPGLMTYAQPLLLPSNPKINQIFGDSDIPLWSISDKSKKIFYIKNEGGKISANAYDFTKKSLSTEPIKTPDNQTDKTGALPQGSKIFTAPDGKKFGLILPAKKTEIILMASAEKDIAPIADIVSDDNIIDEHWDDSSRFFLYLNEKGDIISYDTMSKTSRRILADILGFSIKGENIYYLDRNNLFFYRSSISAPAEKHQLSYVPMNVEQENKKSEKSTPPIIGKNIEILISAKNTLAVITREKELFIIPQNGIPANLGNNIEAAIFSQDGEHIVFNSSFEIFTRSLENNQEDLVTRLSQKISNVSWHNSYTHVWFLANQTIKNIELDSRPSPNIVDFVVIPDKVTEIIYTDSNSIYYDQENNGTLSIYQVEIQK